MVGGWNLPKPSAEFQMKISSQDCIELFFFTNKHQELHYLKKAQKNLLITKKSFNMKISSSVCKLYNEFTQFALENIEILDINTI